MNCNLVLLFLAWLWEKGNFHFVLLHLWHVNTDFWKLELIVSLCDYAIADCMRQFPIWPNGQYYMGSLRWSAIFLRSFTCFIAAGSHIMVETCLAEEVAVQPQVLESRLLRSHARSLGVIDLLLRLEPAVLRLVLSLIPYATARSGQIGACVPLHLGLHYTIYGIWCILYSMVFYVTVVTFLMTPGMSKSTNNANQGSRGTGS